MTTRETPFAPAPSHAGHDNGSHTATRRSAGRDDTTRYLCAAAHLYKDFANGAIREFLVEDTRPVPPSAGVDAAAVLGEAVAARTRRKLRDTGLILLLIGMLFVAPMQMLGMWLVLAVALSVPAMTTALRRQGLPAKPALYLAGGIGAAALLMVLWPEIEQAISGASSSISGSPGFSFEEPETRTEVIVDIVFTGLGVAALLAVLLADRLVVWKHFNERFWPNRGPITAPHTRKRPIFQYSPELFLTQLRRFVTPRATIAEPPPHETPAAAPGEPAQLVVYRGFVPFIGAGIPEEPWSIAVPLKELEDAEPTIELTTDTLYAGIRTEIESLREAITLAPDRRLGHLDITERVLVSADELIDHLGDPSTEDFLAETGVAPYTMLRPARVQSIKVEPVEWARYYQCYEIETWDRDLVMSVFVHVAVGTGALYVEWTPCVLRPIKREYREIDTMPRALWRPLLGAVLDLLRLPASIPARIGHTFSFIRAERRHHDVVGSNSYGVAASLRELAAARRVDNYFQFTDIDRYLKMMEGRLVLAVSRMMSDAGFSPASFDEQAATIVNSNVTIGGNVNGNFAVGNRNKVGGGQPPKDGRG